MTEVDHEATARPRNVLIGRKIVQDLYGTNDETWEESTRFAMREWWSRAERVAEFLDAEFNAHATMLAALEAVQHDYFGALSQTVRELVTAAIAAGRGEAT